MFHIIISIIVVVASLFCIIILFIVSIFVNMVQYILLF